ncbi:PepSY-associated TM helix domain-containing protein [Flocculibacter collagenilyticus]|uniref:PepSY-associated TM helix domain-containing protein n=1 Tax=Flocculibacter collagenilyticus TaxID=2744479 RepID=UPI0018F601B3|nr:PepSY-associated TM helix domain-containing protein [Flocculibacter collagenilyticus]
MKSITIKKLYKLHSWVGLITGILLFVIAFTGAVAVFARSELMIWANDHIRSPIDITPQKYEAIVEEYSQKVDPAYLEEIHIQFPAVRSTDNIRLIFEGHFEQENGKEDHKGVVFELHPITFEQVSRTDMEEYFNHPKLDMAMFLAHFHADLHLGRPVGLILTGLLGLTLMVSIVTGLIIHRKILAQLFTFRPKRNFSLLLNDGHKAMSVWGVLFHSVIAFTGAFLGLATVLLVPAAAYVSFNGDQEALLEKFTAVKAPVVANVESLTKVAHILENSKKSYPDLTFTNFTIMGYGDKNAAMYVFGAGNEQLGRQALVFNGATAEFVRHQANFGRLEGVTGKILDAMFPLHFGNFGGIFIKALWAVLGISTALLPITGLMLWIERGLNTANPAHSRNTYEMFNRLLIGSCAGVVLAAVALFPAQLILNKFYALNDHTSAVFFIFFSVWMFAITLGLVVKKKCAVHVLGYSIASCLLITMPLDAILSGSHIFNVIHTKHFVSMGVNLTTFVLGVLLVLAMMKVKAKQAINQSVSHIDEYQRETA